MIVSIEQLQPLLRDLDVGEAIAIAEMEGGSSPVFRIELASGERLVLKTYTDLRAKTPGKEAFAARQLRDLGVPVTRYLMLDETQTRLPFRFALTNHLPGVTAGSLKDHPGIAAVLDAGRIANRNWLAMPLVAGAALTRYTERSRLLPEPLVLRLVASVARALAHAHAQGVVHRDLKPSNVMVDLTAAHATVLDFGVARIDQRLTTRTGLTLGTPSYMAPELLSGQAASPASDTYALGVMMFEMLCAERPHQASSLGQLLRAIASEPAVDIRTRRADLPETVAEAVNSMVNAQPTRRPHDLQALAVRLDQLAAELEPHELREGR